MPGDNNELFNQWQQNFIKSERFAKQAEREAKETELFSKLQKRMLDNNKEYLKSLVDIEKIQKRIAELEKTGLTHQEAHVTTLKEIRKQYEDVQNEKVEKLKEEYTLQSKLNQLKEQGIDYIVEETQKKQAQLTQEIKLLDEVLKRANERNATDDELNAIYDELKEKGAQQEKTHTELARLMQIQSLNAKQTFGFKKQILGFEDKIAKKEKEISELQADIAINDDEDGSKTEQLNKLMSQQAGLNIAAEIGKAVMAVGQMIFQKFTQKVDNAISTYSSYMGKIEARLQTGQEIDNGRFKSIIDVVERNAQWSPFFSADKVIDAVESLTSEGISYKVTERAFLSSISDKLVAAFEANDETLLRLIRLYHEDITKAMIGNEATLTKLFNQYFEDTKYLTSGLYDRVSAAIYDAQSMLNYEGATEFNFAVQKWLGSLYEAGVAESTVSQISTGINYLATGDVTALNSNQQLATLLNMAAARGGLSYAEMLTGGLDAKNVNILLNSIVDVLKDIAENTGDNVTKSAYRDILGVNVSDLQAIQRVDQSVMNVISSQNMSYSSARTEAENQIYQLIQRTTLAENIDNVLNNMMSSVAYEIADNGANYLLWKIGDVVGQIGDTIGNSAVSAVGLGTQLSAGLWGVIDRLKSNFKLGRLKDVAESDVEAFFEEQGINIGTKTGQAARTGLSSTSWDVDFKTPESWDTRWTKGANKFAEAMSLHSVADAIAEQGEFQNDFRTQYGGLIGAAKSGDLNPQYNDYSSAESKLKPQGESFRSFNQLASDVEQTAQSIMGVQETSTKSVEDIYTKLFETQDVPIKVNISTIDVAALSLLVEALQINNIAEIRDILSDKVSVDIVDQDINSIVDTLRAVRSL